jgi:hypothetical protein
LPQPFPGRDSGATFNLLFVTILPNDSSHSQLQKAAELAKPTLYRGKSALVFVAAAVAAIGTVYPIGLWVDH